MSLKKIEVTKIFRWEAGHRLVKGYPYNCKHLHGHSYRAEITIKPEDWHYFKQDTSYDMVIDFNRLKTIKKWIDQYWDHAFLISSLDSTMKKFLKQHKFRFFEFKGENPTVEVIANYLRDIVCDAFDLETEEVKVKVWETADSFAEAGAVS